MTSAAPRPGWRSPAPLSQATTLGTAASVFIIVSALTVSAVLAVAALAVPYSKLSSLFFALAGGDLLVALLVLRRLPGRARWQILASAALFPVASIVAAVGILSAANALLSASAMARAQTARTPERAGLVAAVEPLAGRRATWTLTDGSAVTIDYNEAEHILGGGAATPGGLLLYGRDEGGSWFAVVGRDFDCFTVEATVTDVGASFYLEQWDLRLAKARAFADEHGGLVFDAPARLCLDDAGRVRRSEDAGGSY